MFIKLIVLAIIQGITEFLPVSSSGHLQFLSLFLTMNQESLLLYFLVLHAGTSLAALYFFRKDIIIILHGLVDVIARKQTQNSQDALKWIVLIICVSIPTAFSGILVKSYIKIDEYEFFNLGIAWILTSGILLGTKYIKSNTLELHNFTYKQAFLVGIAQSLALLPGISRSGSTIAMALFLGATPLFAGKLSFLASFVAIFGALLSEIIDYINIGYFEFSIIEVSLGFIISFIIGLLSLKYLIHILKHGKLFVFSIYCFILGIVSIIIHFINIGV